MRRTTMPTGIHGWSALCAGALMATVAMGGCEGARSRSGPEASGVDPGSGKRGRPTSPPETDPASSSDTAAPVADTDGDETPGAPHTAEEPSEATSAKAEAEAPPPPTHLRRRARRRSIRGSGYGRGAGSLGLVGRGVGGGGMAAPRDDLAGIRPPSAAPNREGYDERDPNPFIAVADQPLSTFSADVDTASYSNIRRMLKEGRLPPPSAVRVEEMLNYFRYDYPEPAGGQPFGIHTGVGACPWAPDHKLVHIGLRTRDIPVEDLPPRNLVFLLDVSGSMQPPNKLPLLRRAMGLLVDQMRPQDRVAMVVYAGASGVVLQSTSGERRNDILAALERLEAGGSTNGGAGIELAYRIAEKHRIEGGINRVILATDGDFNVGTSSRGELARLIEKKRRGGTYLTVLGFGTGNVQDGTMEMLADKGNGNYAYIDSLAEARKVLVREAGATLATVADDVKLQVELNPKAVSRYRLIGYENRLLAARDFNDDTKDAGEVGAGHMVTVLYEVVPRGADAPQAAPGVDPLRYQGDRDLTAAADSDELMTLKIRHKAPGEAKSTLLTRSIRASEGSEADRDFRFATAVAGFGLWLREDPHWTSLGVRSLRRLAAEAVGEGGGSDRRELVQLVERAARMADRAGRR